MQSPLLKDKESAASLDASSAEGTTPRESPADKPEFPKGPAKIGNIYSMDTPFDQRVVIMAEQTWITFGTTQEAMRHMLSKQDARIKELLAENALSKQVAADAMVRLENIRHVRRNEMKKRIEGQVEDLVLPGDQKFNLPSKRKN